MSETEKPKIVFGRRLIEALLESGIVRSEDRVRRLVIDVPHDGAVVMHVERYGDTRLLDIVQTLDGIEIKRDEPTPRYVLEFKDTLDPAEVARTKAAIDKAMESTPGVGA